MALWCCYLRSDHVTQIQHSRIKMKTQWLVITKRKGNPRDWNRAFRRSTQKYVCWCCHLICYCNYISIQKVALAWRQRKNLSVFASRWHLPVPTAHLSTTHGGGFTLSFFYYWTSIKEAVNTNFYSLWFDLIWNRTQFYRFSSKRSLYLMEIGLVCNT